MVMASRNVPIVFAVLARMYKPVIAPVAAAVAATAHKPPTDTVMNTAILPKSSKAKQEY